MMDFWQRERIRIREWLRGSKRHRHMGMAGQDWDNPDPMHIEYSDRKALGLE